MAKRIIFSMLGSLVIMAILTLHTTIRRLEINDPQISPVFYLTSYSKGIPLHYQTSYGNTSGIYGSLIPRNTGLQMGHLITDYLLWLVLFMLCSLAPLLLKKPPIDESLRQRSRYSH